MRILALRAYEFFTVFLPFLAVFIISTYTGKTRPSKGRFVPLLALAVYLFAVFALTGAGTLYDVLSGVNINPAQINLTLFQSARLNSQHYLNILLFVPFGFLLPLLWPRCNKILLIFFSGFLFSLVIELSQLLNHRLTDVDDLVLNTAGAIIGLLLYKLFALVSNRRKNPPQSPKAGPLLYVGTMFLGHFFLYNPHIFGQILNSIP